MSLAIGRCVRCSVQEHVRIDDLFVPEKFVATVVRDAEVVETVGSPDFVKIKPPNG